MRKNVHYDEKWNSKKGKILFSERRITIECEDKIYYVHPPRAFGYIHGDVVGFSETRMSKDGKLPEAKPERLIKRTENQVIVQASIERKGIRWSLLPIFGKLPIELTSNPRIEDGDLYKAKFVGLKRVEILEKFGNINDKTVRESLILFQGGVRTEWSEEISKIKKEKEHFAPVSGAIFGQGILPQQLSIKDSIFPLIDVYARTRLDFRSWYTLTIDGADAKDLDDAISIAEYEGGDMLLGVHIADVAEYVEEDTPLDREAYERGTSIYLPGRVIPMLPESLSNDLCSLHPGEPKLTLSILLRIDRQGFVKESFVTESVIESQYRGIYEEVGKCMHQKNEGTELSVLSLHNKGRESLSKSSFENTHNSLSNLKEKEIPTGGQKIPGYLLNNFQKLYHTLRERRKKEGKIIFDMTECYFDTDEERNVRNIRKRERGEAHMMIEEYMVLANEEVAKWCAKRKIPFLSRVHDAPSAEKSREIHDVLEANSLDSIMGNGESEIDIEPHHIRSILEHAKSDEELYRLSRLLLPKMAKAIYAEKSVRHFGLALTYYAHYTSPIRRYPDLLLHRMIKKHLSKTLSTFEKKKYDKEMKKWGESLSQKERNAEDISRAVDDLFMCEYISKHVGSVEEGVISGLTESNIYVELSNGVEGSIYLARKAPLSRGEEPKAKGGFSRLSPLVKVAGGEFDSHEKLILDLTRGSLRDVNGKEVYRIGEKMRVKIASVDMDTRRIEMNVVTE